MSLSRIFLSCVCVVGLLAVSTPSWGQTLIYSQDWETFDAAGGTPGPGDDSWLVFGNVFEADGTTFIYPYGPFAAPNGGPGFSGIVDDQGGPMQGTRQLSVYNDYNNADHTNENAGRRIESNVYREWTVAASDVGTNVVFRFNAKGGNVGGATTANAFIKVLKQSDESFALLENPTFDTTNLPAVWGNHCVQLTIDASHQGELFQIGFVTTAANEDPSTNYYDNIDLSVGGLGIDPDTDGDLIIDCADADDDNDAVADSYDRLPLDDSNAKDKCTNNDPDNAALSNIAINDTRTCAAKQSVVVDQTTSVLGGEPGGDLRVVSPTAILKDMSVIGSMEVINADPCDGPGCPPTNGE